MNGGIETNSIDLELQKEEDSFGRTPEAQSSNFCPWRYAEKRNKRLTHTCTSSELVDGKNDIHPDTDSRMVLREYKLLRASFLARANRFRSFLSPSGRISTYLGVKAEDLCYAVAKESL